MDGADNVATAARHNVRSIIYERTIYKGSSDFEDDGLISYTVFRFQDESGGEIGRI